MEQAKRFDGTQRQAYRLVINHCPPTLSVDLELKLTRLTATALLVGIEESWLVTHLQHGRADTITERVKRSLH